MRLFVRECHASVHSSAQSRAMPSGVSEVQSAEALPLLLTLSSGVQGFTTIHSGSARQALSRLRFICQLADAASDLQSSALTALVSEAVGIRCIVLATSIACR